MSEPVRMPIELILAAADYECPCTMSMCPNEEARCNESATHVVYMSHANGTPMCDGVDGLPLCDHHTRNLRLGLTGSPLIAILGVPPFPPCGACGVPLALDRITTVRGVPA